MKKQLFFVAIFCAVFGLCNAGCECPANCDGKDTKKVEEVAVAPKAEETTKAVEENKSAEEKTINEEEFAKFSKSLKDEEKPADVKEAAAPVDESKKA
jgi:hypothetical protein